MSFSLHPKSSLMCLTIDFEYPQPKQQYPRSVHANTSNFEFSKSSI